MKNREELEKIKREILAVNECDRSVMSCEEEALLDAIDLIDAKQEEIRSLQTEIARAEQPTVRWFLKAITDAELDHDIDRIKGLTKVYPTGKVEYTVRIAIAAIKDELRRRRNAEKGVDQ